MFEMEWSQAAVAFAEPREVNWRLAQKVFYQSALADE
jgi:hypothetical protein